MKHLIDPNNDYVVKMMLARQSKSHILLHFLQSVVEPTYAVTNVYIQDPHNFRQVEDDKLSIADSLAKDEHGHFYQVEIQNSAPDYLSSRMSYTAYAIFSSQLSSGDNYDKAKPIHSIWFLNESMFEGEDYIHRLTSIDEKTRAILPESKFYIVELNKWQSEIPLERMNKEQLLTLQPLYYWLYFMKEAKNWLVLPEPLNHIPIMRELMNILEEISDRSENYARYLSAQDALRVKRTEEALREKAEKSLLLTKEQLTQAETQLNQAETQLNQERIDTALKLIALNSMSVEQIADISKLSVTQVNDLIRA